MTRLVKRDGKLPGRNAAARKAEIVEAAGRLFASSGYGSTSTAEIAREANISEGTLFHHFPNKRAILAEVGAKEAEKVLAVAFQGIDRKGQPPEMAAMLRRLFRYARENGDAYRLFLMDGTVEDLGQGFDSKRARIVQGLATSIASWSARGYVRQLDPDIAAELVFALIDCSVRQLVLSGHWESEEAWIAELLVALDSILSPPLTQPTQGAKTRQSL